ncbi:hypothetical protein [Flavobacterium sangjuense]|uniref:Uncharacterized protein n=1 Tax=Flavobacterium sangjuense TaxID=2518177 RepID=A0A4P7PUB6_9FLAO|nr:hypothetical protein [Flavobacterium sangjuense]QBZ98255.1 hypothetical protein GS03_01760 [Flavobacterium sangjuense]
MKEATNFLKEELFALYNTHKYLEIRYEFDSIIDTHIIEVKPVHCFEKDRQFADKQIVLEEKFRNLFPQEDILFITENILIKVENPILELGVSNHVLVGEIFNSPVKARRYSPSQLICNSAVLAEPPSEYSYNTHKEKDPKNIGSFSFFNTLSL